PASERDSFSLASAGLRQRFMWVSAMVAGTLASGLITSLYWDGDTTSAPACPLPNHDGGFYESRTAGVYAPAWSRANFIRAALPRWARPASPCPRERRERAPETRTL